LRLQARRDTAALCHAPVRQKREAHHQPQGRPRRHVAALAAEAQKMNHAGSVMKRNVLLLALLSVPPGARASAPPAPTPLIGYTEFRTNLPGGRHANVCTMRAVVIRADGTGRRVLAPKLARKADTWTQFAGWSPDGKIAIVGQGWQSPENAKWEEK